MLGPIAFLEIVFLAINKQRAGKIKYEDFLGACEDWCAHYDKEMMALIESQKKINITQESFQIDAIWTALSGQSNIES